MTTHEEQVRSFTDPSVPALKETKLSPNSRRAIEKYGQDVCTKAFMMHHKDGEGASTVGIYLGLTTNQADAAINAGRELRNSLLAEPNAMEPSMESQRDMLAQAIAEAGAKVGIIDPEIPLTGPQLLMVLDDLVSIITAKAPKTCECGDPDCLKGSQSFTPDKE